MFLLTNFIRYPSSQASADPTSDVYIVAFSFSIYELYVTFHEIAKQAMN